MIKPRLKTSSDISPAPGVVNGHSLQDFIFDYEMDGIDVVFEEARIDAERSIRAELEEDGISEGDDAFDDQLEEKMQEFYDSYENDYKSVLLGDWVKNADGRYEIDRNGREGWAATYSNSSGAIFVVEYSKYVAECAPTSPCYLRADTGTPCGDLDTPASGRYEPVVAYSFPPDFYQQ
jgi:hypothetical protein